MVKISSSGTTLMCSAASTWKKPSYFLLSSKFIRLCCTKESNKLSHLLYFRSRATIFQGLGSCTHGADVGALQQQHRTTVPGQEYLLARMISYLVFENLIAKFWLFDILNILKAISFKNEVEKSFPQKFADLCSQQKNCLSGPYNYLKVNMNMF